jgi:hypothetical protein
MEPTYVSSINGSVGSESGLRPERCYRVAVGRVRERDVRTVSGHPPCPLVERLWLERCCYRRIVRRGHDRVVRTDVAIRSEQDLVGRTLSVDRDYDQMPWCARRERDGDRNCYRAWLRRRCG